MKGQAGGIALVKKYGREHMSNIGRKGAKRFWQLYRVQPVHTSGWAIVSRKTGIIVAFNNYYERD